jgi:hypothetical protein
LREKDARPLPTVPRPACQYLIDCRRLHRFCAILARRGGLRTTDIYDHKVRLPQTLMTHALERLRELGDRGTDLARLLNNK